MPAKTIFLCSTNDADDLKLVRSLRMHICINSKLSVWHHSMLSGGDDIVTEVTKQFQQCEIFMPVLTVNYLNDADCMVRFKNALGEGKLVLPLFARSFDIDAVSELDNLRDNIILNDKEPIDSNTNLNKALTDVSETLRVKLFGSQALPHLDSKWYNIILLLVALLAAVAFLITSSFQNLSPEITIGGSILFAVIALVPLAKIIFPTNVNN